MMLESLILEFQTHFYIFILGLAAIALNFEGWFEIWIDFILVNRVELYSSGSYYFDEEFEI